MLFGKNQLVSSCLILIFLTACHSEPRYVYENTCPIVIERENQTIRDLWLNYKAYKAGYFMCQNRNETGMIE